MSAAAPGDELVDVLDDAGTVVGSATRAEVRAGNLWHRTVFIAVVTADDRVVVHRRADWKDVYPGYWDVAFGGVVAAGEAWSVAAARELAEEAGIEATLELLGEGRYDEPDGREVAHIYLARHDGPFTCPDGEVVAVDLVPRHALGDWLDARPVCPDSRALVVPRLTELPG